MGSTLAGPSGVRLAATGNQRAVANDPDFLQSGDSAFCALTDFRREDPITVEADSPIEDALGDMNHLGIHALLVTRQEPEGIEQQVVGLITYYDAATERPSTGASVSRERPKALVGDVMTPCSELPLVKYDSLQSLTAHDLYELFQGTGLTHLLVVETQPDGAAVARGLISRATLARRLRRLHTAVV